MPNFHRLTVPTYSGGLPSGYDYINNATSGTPAPADGARVGGPNAGTYFVGFGDDGTSLNANRPALALAQNTDYLDNLLHQDLAVPLISTLITSAGDTSFIAVGEIFVGVPGTPNTPAGIATFVKLLDSNGNEIVVPSTGQQCVVTAISGATVGTGFSSSNVTFTISPAVPSGVQYRVYYAIKGNLATLPADALTNINIRSVQELPAGFEDFEKMISRFSGLNVVALVGTIFETPDGSRLSRAATQVFDVDPDGGNGGTPTWTWRSGRDTIGATSWARLVGLTNYLSTGYSGALELGSGVVLSNASSLIFSDLLTRNYNTDMFKGAIPLAGNTARSGQFLVADSQPQTSDSMLDTCILSALNSRVITCGDGTHSFGDFTGVDSIYRAITYIRARSLANNPVKIYVKAGAYTITDSTLVNIPASWNVTIQGAGRLKTVIFFATTSAAGITAASSLVLRSLSIQKTGTGTIAVDFSSGNLAMDDVLLTDAGLFGNDPSQFSNLYAQCVLIENCSILSSVTGTIPLTIKVSNNSAQGVSGVVVKNTYIFTPDDTPACLLQGNSTLSAGTSTVIERVLFERCTYALSQATTSTSFITNNSGVIDFDPNGAPGSGRFTVRDVTFKDCRVIVNNASSSKSAIFLYALNSKHGSSGVVSIGKISIDGGYWSMQSATTATHFTPFVIQSQHIDVRNVRFTMTNGGSGVQEAQVAAAYTAVATAQWGAFAFLPQKYSTTPPDGVLFPGLVLKNVKFENFGRDTQCGDLFILASDRGNDVSDVVLSNYANTTNSLTAPNHRVYIRGTGLNGGVGGKFSGIQIDIPTAATWIDNSGSNKGFFLLRPELGLHLTNCRALLSPSQAGAAYTVEVDNVSNASEGLFLENCCSQGGDHGVLILGLATHTRIDVTILGGQYEKSSSYGIVVTPFTDSINNSFKMTGVSVTDSSTSPGLIIDGPWNNAASNTPQDAINITGCEFVRNTDTVNTTRPRQVAIDTTGVIAGTFTGNNLGGTFTGTSPNCLYYNDTVNGHSPAMLKGLWTGITAATPAYTDNSPMILNCGRFTTT